MILEGMTRFLLEMLRTEPAVAGQLSLSMIIGLGLVAGGVVLWIAFGRYGARESLGTGSAVPVATPA